MNFKGEIDRELIRRKGGSSRFAKLRIEVPAADAGHERAPLNIAIVIDRSGSMSGEKITFAREAAMQVVRTLGSRDRFSVVCYDNEIDILVPSTLADAEAKAAAERAIRTLDARGTTNLCEGWMQGCKQIAEFLDDEQFGRCLLLSDGLANQGITDPRTILEHVVALQRRQVSTSTFGIGADFDEVLMKSMAERGGGNFYFIESAGQIPEYVARELGENLEVVARDAVLRVRAPARTTVESLNDYPVSQQNGEWIIELGSLVSRQLLEPVVRFIFPAGVKGETAEVELMLDDRDGAMAGSSLAFTFRYAGSRDTDGQPRNRAVDRVVARLFAARAMQQALALNRDGDCSRAQKVLRDAAARIRRYAGEDPEILAVISELEAKERRLAFQLDPMARKRMYASEWRSMKLRDVNDMAMRW
jgi:Ca-activated chloride channel family protein